MSRVQLRHPGVLALVCAAFITTSMSAAEVDLAMGTAAQCGDYLLNNSIYDWADANGGGLANQPGSWQTAMYNTGSGSGWGAKWGIYNPKNGNVKGYPSMILGWNWEYDWSNYATALGQHLPRQITSTSTAYSQFAATNSYSWGGWDQSYGLWVTSDGNRAPTTAGNQIPAAEIMIWTSWAQLQPANNTPGQNVVQFTHNGVLYDRYIGTAYGFGHSWPLITYARRTQSQDSGSLNLMDFLRNSGQSGKYLAGIQAGWETVVGEAQFLVTTYWITLP